MSTNVLSNRWTRTLRAALLAAVTLTGCFGPMPEAEIRDAQQAMNSARERHVGMRAPYSWREAEMIARRLEEEVGRQDRRPAAFRSYVYAAMLARSLSAAAAAAEAAANTGFELEGIEVPPEAWTGAPRPCRCICP